MRSEWIFEEELRHVLAALTEPNRLACAASLKTGLRIDDVLHIRTAQLSERMTVTEQKTGKKRRGYIGRDLFEQLQAIAGRKWVFEGRLDWKSPRTRQAVWKDIKRAALLFRLKENVSPHTCRKVYAVSEYHKCHDLKRVQSLLNHSSEAVTVLYALADELVLRRRRKTRSCASKPLKSNITDK